MENLKKLAARLDVAASEASPITQLSHEDSFSIEEAYEIQLYAVEERYKRGEKLIGLKMGFTSEAKMKQMGVHDMIWGRLTNEMRIENGGKTASEKYIHPRAEPEICFLVKEKITRELTLEEAPEYVQSIAAAVEIIDSRYQNFKFSLEDVIADNCSSSGVVVGEWQSAKADLNRLGIALEIDGKLIHEGNSNAILNNPWKSFVAATRLAAQYGQPIEAGHIIMAGAATPASFIHKGNEVKAVVEGLGSAGFYIT